MKTLIEELQTRQRRYEMRLAQANGSDIKVYTRLLKEIWEIMKLVEIHCAEEPNEQEK